MDLGVIAKKGYSTFSKFSELEIRWFCVISRTFVWVVGVLLPYKDAVGVFYTHTQPTGMFFLVSGGFLSCFCFCFCFSYSLFFVAVVVVVVVVVTCLFGWLVVWLVVCFLLLLFCSCFSLFFFFLFLFVLFLWCFSSFLLLFVLFLFSLFFFWGGVFFFDDCKIKSSLEKKLLWGVDITSKNK